VVAGGGLNEKGRGELPCLIDGEPGPGAVLGIRRGAVTMTCGSSASTTVPAGVARTTTLQGSSRPMLRSMPSAWKANAGLQAPRMM
jgi:hypothetical protein